MIAIGRRTSRQGWAALLPLSSIALVAAIAFSGQIWIFSRIMGGIDASQDYSIFVRVFGPLQILPDFLFHHPLGLPYSGLESRLSYYSNPLGIDASEYLVNGLFNLFFEFGIIGFALLLVILIKQEVILVVYFLGSMLNNGSFLAPDKFAVIGFFMLLYTGLRKGADTKGQAIGIARTSARPNNRNVSSSSRPRHRSDHTSPPCV